MAAREVGDSTEECERHDGDRYERENDRVSHGKRGTTRTGRATSTRASAMLKALIVAAVRGGV